MLGKAKNLFENLQTHWNSSGSYSDDFQLSLYAAIEEEFDSGNVKKGLLAKVSVEANYDEKVAKAKYIKARVDSILTKKEEIQLLTNQLREVNRALIEAKESYLQISNQAEVDPEPTNSDYELAKKKIQEDCAAELAAFEDIPLLFARGCSIFCVSQVTGLYEHPTGLRSG